MGFFYRFLTNYFWMLIGLSMLEHGCGYLAHHFSHNFFHSMILLNLGEKLIPMVTISGKPFFLEILKYTSNIFYLCFLENTYQFWKMIPSITYMNPGKHQNKSKRLPDVSLVLIIQDQWLIMNFLPNKTKKEWDKSIKHYPHTGKKITYLFLFLIQK